MKNKKLMKQIMKFIVVGGIATLLDWIIYYILYNYVHIPPLIANVISFSISVVYNYFASIKWVFEVDQEKSKKKLFFLFLLFSIIGLLISELLLWIMINHLNIHEMISKIITTIVVMIFNFITRKKFLE